MADLFPTLYDPSTIDYEVAGPDDDDYLDDDIMMFGGPDDYDDYDDEEGAPVYYDPETGGFLKGLGKKFRKLRSRILPKYKRKAAKRKKKRKLMRIAAATMLANKGTVTSVAQRQVPTQIAGARYITEKGCTIAVSPIPLETRVPVGPASQAMIQGPVQMPHAPVVGSLTYSGGTQYAKIDPYYVFNLTPGELTPSGGQAVLGMERAIKLFALKVDIGLPGVNAAAGVPISFDVFTTKWYWDLLGSSGLAPNCTTGPMPTNPAPEIVQQYGAFSTGNIIITPNSIAKAASLVILGYDVVQAMPQPKIFELSVRLTNQAPSPCWVDPYPDTPSAPYQLRGVALRMTSAPANTVASITLLTPTHPEWQALVRLLQTGQGM